MYDRAWALQIVAVSEGVHDGFRANTIIAKLAKEVERDAHGKCEQIVGKPGAAGRIC